MARLPENDFAQRATDSAKHETASLSAKTAPLPSHLEPRAGQVSDGDRSASQPSRLGLLGRLIHGLAWLVTLALAVVALLRLFDHDGIYFLTWINAFTRYVYLPAYLCLGWAVWKRRWFLALVNLAIVSLHIALVAPDLMRDRRFESAANASIADAANDLSLRIFFANVNGPNTEFASLFNEIKEADPDVIILAEFSWQWHVACQQSPVFAKYPYGGGREIHQLGIVNVFSRIPLKSNQEKWFAGRCLQTIEIPVGSETLRIIGLHAPRPMNKRIDGYEDFWRGALPIILNERGPLIVVGDFNATQYSDVYGRLTADHLRSAHQDRGRGYATSWPNGRQWLPPIRIDQAFLSPEVECVEIKEGEGRGSDHKPLILDVRIRAPH